MRDEQLTAMAAAPAAWGGTLLGVAVVSAIPLAVAMMLPGDPIRLRRLSRWLVSFATGALLGAAFLHMIPEALRVPGHGSLGGALVLLGLLSFFLLERYMWRHGHATQWKGASLPPLATMNLIGDALHNALDGMAIAAAFVADPSVGIATTTAVVLHEVPQEIGDFGILLHAGLGRTRAILWNLASAIVAFAGALLVLVVGTFLADAATTLLPIAAGGFVYIAASDLIPELREETREIGTGVLLVAIALGAALSALPLLMHAS